MVVFSNRRLGPTVELLLTDEVATEILRVTAAAARPYAHARWEHELVRWLEDRGANFGLVAGRGALDIGDIAWTPDHFELQRRFLIDAIDRAAQDSEYGPTLQRWSRMVEAHPRDSVQVGRLWQWQATA